LSLANEKPQETLCCRIIGMNIAMISPYSWDFPGGVNRHVEQLSARLRENGHYVTMVAPGGEESKEFHNAGKSFSIRFNRSVANLSFGPRSAAAMKGFLKENGFDLLHLHEPLIPSTSMLGLHYAECATLATFHAAREGGSRAYALARPLLGKLARKIDVRVAVSRPALELVSHYFPSDYRIIPNGVDTSQYSPQGEKLPGLDPGLFYLLFIGRAEPRKGLDVLLEAFTRIRKARPEARLLVAGVENPTEKMDGVIWLGRLTDDQVPMAYRSARLLVSPALGSESFGIILIEAMASGVPVVASSIPGYRAVVDDGVQGKLVTPDSSDGLADTIIRLIENEDMLKEMSAAALHKSREYSWDKLVSLVEKAYSEAIAAHGRAS
jgi:phosphatidyl-myo-inositol alpha-mannosyltransferase